jgi:hypothetical protein
VVLPELMATIDRKSLLIPDLLPSLDEVSGLLLYWAIEGKEGRFHVAKAVLCTPRLQGHLPISNEEPRELRLCIGMYCSLVNSLYVY